MTKIEIGSKIKYIYNGKLQVGKVHAIKTHEEPSGKVIKVSYLIDTGKENPEHIGRFDRQPEQIEVDSSNITLI